MIDARFDGYPTDGQFPTPGADTRHDGYPADARFDPFPTDQRFPLVNLMGTHTSLGSNWTYANGIYSIDTVSAGGSVGEIRWDNLGLTDGQIFDIYVLMANYTTFPTIRCKMNAGAEHQVVDGENNFQLTATAAGGMQFYSLAQQSTADILAFQIAAAP
jgi:hypothetical protein